MKQLIQNLLALVVLILIGIQARANGLRKDFIENSVEQLNYLHDHNQEQITKGSKDKWYIYFLDGTIEDLEYIMSEVDNVELDYLHGLNERLEKINASDKTAVYVAFTLYEKAIVTPLFPKDYTTLELQQNYIEDYFKGSDSDRYVEQFSIYAKEYQETLKGIYERSWLKNLDKRNVLLPFSMYTLREIIDKKQGGYSLKSYSTYTLYAPSMAPGFEKEAFKKLYEQQDATLGKTAMEQKMERMVMAIDAYFINGTLPEYKQCEELLVSERYKDLVEQLDSNDIWIQIIEENPCILDSMYSAGNDYVDSSQFEKELAMVVCTPLYMALALPVVTVAGEAVALNTLRKIGQKKLKDASLAIIYSSLIQFSYNYYFDDEVSATVGQEARIKAAVEKINVQEVLGEGLKEAISSKIRGKVAIACIAEGIKFEDHKWYDPTKLERLDLGDCLQAILTEYGTLIATETASPLLKRLKELIKTNPKQFVRGFREILNDAGLPDDMKKKFFASLKQLKGQVDELNILDINIDIEIAISDAVREFAEEAGHLTKKSNLPTPKANFSLSNAIKDAASDLKLRMRSGGSDVTEIGANVTLNFEGIGNIRPSLLVELKDGGYKMVFVLDNDVPMNGMDDLLQYVDGNRVQVLNAIKNGNAPKITLKGSNAQKYFGKSDAEVSIKEIGVYTVDGDGNVVGKNILVETIDDIIRGVSKNNFVNSVPEFLTDTHLGDKAWELFKNEDWKGLENLVNSNGINGGWAPNNGFKNISHVEVGSELAGKIFDRFQGFEELGGSFASPVLNSSEGVADLVFTYDSRALANAIDEGTHYIKFRIKENLPSNIEFNYGGAIPWFNLSGNADQVKSNVKFQDLFNDGYIEILEVLKREGNKWEKVK